MNYILYALVLVPINLIGTVLTFPLAFIIGILYSTQIGWCNNGTIWESGPRLFSFVSWFQTPDNSLDGDQTFRAEHNPCWWSYPLSALHSQVAQVRIAMRQACDEVQPDAEMFASWWLGDWRKDRRRAAADSAGTHQAR